MTLGTCELLEVTHCQASPSGAIGVCEDKMHEARREKKSAGARLAHGSHDSITPQLTFRLEVAA